MTLTNLPSITLPFPPDIRAFDIAHKRIRSKICQKSPNAFFIYRKVFVDHLSKLQHKLKMTDVSKLVGYHWKSEPVEVKMAYENIAREVEKELNNIRNKDLVYEDIHEKCRRKRNKQIGKNNRKSLNSRTRNSLANFDAGANLITTLDFSVKPATQQVDDVAKASLASPNSTTEDTAINVVQFVDDTHISESDLYVDHVEASTNGVGMDTFDSYNNDIRVSYENVSFPFDFPALSLPEPHLAFYDQSITFDSSSTISSLSDHLSPQLTEEFLESKEFHLSDIRDNDAFYGSFYLTHGAFEHFFDNPNNS
ncbi:5713_t:CDS:1 [Acaulospora morrowiae]|uniref:5713_t:CDS:1 n=1 Tax=Acaulospora morrowiae TaxID=94023 RepID=A0A9N9D6I0_9GLOM|nr:5713_t:CDS:1 [Acaulospora morrowiae]